MYYLSTSASLSRDEAEVRYKHWR